MRLTDYFIDLIAYVACLVKVVPTKQPPFEQVRMDVIRFLGKSEECVQKGECQQDEYDLARFVVCAWVDESILGSQWQHKGQWQTEQLQRIYYNTFEAGEEVFDKLNLIGLQQNSVREIYYLCLCLGFKGKFVRREDDYLLDQLKTSNLKLIFGSSVSLPSLDRVDLFPESYPAETMSGDQKNSHKKTRLKFSFFTIAALAAPALFFGLLFLVYHFSLNGLAENILKTVHSS